MSANNKNHTDIKKQKERYEKDKERYEKDKAAYKVRVRPLVQFLKKHKLRFNNAQVGEVSIEYFRLDDLQKLVEKHKEEIEKNEELSGLVKNRNKEFVFFRRPENLKAKYPRNLEPVDPSHADKKFASFRFDTSQTKVMRTVFLVLAVLSIVMFPIWPFEVKYGIWLICMAFLILMVGLIVIRILIYLPCAIFDYHIWIFPNLLISNGFLDSFIPFIEVARGDKSWFNVFVRLFAVSSFLLLVLHIYLNPTFIEDSTAFTRQIIQDAHDWGVKKIQNEGNFSQRAISNLDTILNETADVDADKPQSQVVVPEPPMAPGEPEPTQQPTAQPVQGQL